MIDKEKKDDLKFVGVLLLLSVLLVMFAMMFDMQDKIKIRECTYICEKFNHTFKHFEGDKCACVWGLGKIYYVNRSESP